jgi:hypothetical protein
MAHTNGFDMWTARKKDGQRRRWAKKYRLGSQCRTAQLVNSFYRIEHRPNVKAASRSKRHVRKNVCSTKFIRKHGPEEVGACCPANNVGTGSFGCTRSKDVRPRLFNQTKYKTQHLTWNKIIERTSKRKIRIEREKYKQTILSKMVEYSNKGWDALIDGSSDFYDRPAIIDLLKESQQDGWYPYMRFVTLGSKNSKIMKMFKRIFQDSSLRLEMVVRMGSPRYRDTIGYCNHKIDLVLVDGSGCEIKTVDFMTILTTDTIDRREYYYYVTDSRLICRVRGREMEQILEFEQRKQSSDVLRTIHLTRTVQGKGIEFGGSSGTEKAAPDEDDDLTEYEIGKILRDSISRDF